MPESPQVLITWTFVIFILGEEKMKAKMKRLASKEFLAGDFFPSERKYPEGIQRQR